ncbi:MAG: hypothetical protein WD018_06685 [Nitrosopumilaceae archaeon]
MSNTPTCVDFNLNGSVDSSTEEVTEPFKLSQLTKGQLKNVVNLTYPSR